MKRKELKPILYKHGGCEGCANRKCRYNAPVATKEKAEATKGYKFNCNTSKENPWSAKEI